MAIMYEETFRLTSIFGPADGVDAVAWARFKRLLEAHLCLGHAISIAINKNGVLKLNADQDEI